MSRCSHERKHATREKLIALAAKSLWERGQLLSMDSFMASAGLTRGGFYRHFSSMEELSGYGIRYALSNHARSLAAICDLRPSLDTLRFAEGTLIDHMVSVPLLGHSPIASDPDSADPVIEEHLLAGLEQAFEVLIRLYNLQDEACSSARSRR